MNWRDLEDELYEAIRQCCQTEEDVESAKKYFGQWLVSEMIDDALRE